LETHTIEKLKINNRDRNYKFIYINNIVMPTKMWFSHLSLIGLPRSIGITR